MSIQKTKSGKFQVRVYGLPAKSFDTRKEALAHHAKLENFKTNRPDATISSKTLFSEVARCYLENIERDLEYNTYKSYESKYRIWIAPYLATFQIGNINPITIKSFQDQIEKKGIGNATFDIVNIVLYEILNYATSPLSRYIADNPMPNTGKKRTIKKPLSHLDYLSLEEANKFLDVAKGSPYYDSIIFILNTGLRFNEFCCIQKDSFDLSSESLSIYQQICARNKNGANFYIKLTKGKENRFIPMNSIVKELVKKLTATSKDLFLFCPGDTEYKNIEIKKGNKVKIESHKIMTNRTFSYALESISKKAGVKNVGPHGLRHTFSAHFLMNGGDIFTLSKRLGHKSINTTIENYGHLSNDFIKQSANIVSFGESR